MSTSSHPDALLSPLRTTTTISSTTSSQSGTAPRRPRQAPPALFVHPPSRVPSTFDNRPSATLSAVDPPSKRIPLTRARSATADTADTQPFPRFSTSSQTDEADALGEDVNIAARPGSGRPGYERTYSHGPADPNYSVEGSADNNKFLSKDVNATTGRRGSGREQIDALWAEMQNTLEEVELSAAGGAAVFSREHARALEELRRAQVELARAWTRGGEEEEGDGEQGGAALGLRETMSAGGAMFRSAGEQEGKGAQGGTNGGQGSNGTDKGQLERETENDIALARQRRAANDRYFEKVNKGVVDVVRKLQIVAARMKDVEEESQDIWTDKGSVSDSASSR